MASPELAIGRVSVRVTKGGHSVPEVVIRGRYHRSAKNLLQLYLPLADRLRVYDNSTTSSPILLAEKSAGRLVEVYDEMRWDSLRSEAERDEEAGSDEG